MAKVSRGHTITAGITLVALLLLAEGAGAVKEINSCTDITSPDTYVLSANIVNSAASRCINITSSNVILDGAGYTIDGTGAEGTYGILVYDPAGMGLKNINVKNLKVTDWYYGIYYGTYDIGYFETKDGSITDNFISSNHSGITLEYTSNHTLTNNSVISGGINIAYSWGTKITNNNAGISLGHSYDNTITDNNASSRGGIYFYYVSDNIVTRNDVSSNRYGISTSFAIRNTLADNRVTESGTGIYLGPATESNTITDNDISTNGYGISSHGASNNTITNNTVSSNDYGIYLADSSNNNIIYNNYFNNTNNAWDDGNNIWNIRKTAGTNVIGGSWLGGNYWSDYAGEDINGDGLGETLIPYNSENITNGGDNLPLVRTSVFHVVTGIGFSDMNRNGVRDAGEEGLENWTIQLKGTEKHTGRIVKRTAITGTSGNYVFADLKPGIYIISEVQKQGWIPTTSPVRPVRLAEGQNTIVDFGNKKIR
ncbi:MAG: right-handed parallel beta-helix repeat-containing protein [Candidatus Methanoperedens sp.]|nr:right-handed parallel beta-helix repeat-containing protein [Candidatus Methanoperedens sp.]